MSLMVSFFFFFFFLLSFSPRDVLNEIWDLTESVSESFPTCSFPGKKWLYCQTSIEKFYYIAIFPMENSGMENS